MRSRIILNSRGRASRGPENTHGGAMPPGRQAPTVRAGGDAYVLPLEKVSRVPP